MMKNQRMAVLVFLVLLGGIGTLGAATQPKFQSSGDPGLGRYVVTLAGDAGADDPAALRQELASLYGARLDASAPADVRQFTVTMTQARARLLSSDPRVSEVAEAPSSAPAAPAPASSSRHFTAQTAGYGDNGQSDTYLYDGSGDITFIGTDSYLYDLEGRLKISVTRGVEEDYSYDAFGNRKSATGGVNCLGQTTCAQPVTIDPANTNRLVAINGAAVTYDSAGNLTNIAAAGGSPATTYVYDGTAMMTEATVGSDDRQFVYTADDERIAVKQGVSWTWTVRDLSEKVLREFTSMETGGPNFAMTTRVWVKDYVWRDSLLLATTTPNGTLDYHLDHLGTPRLVTDVNSVKVAEHAYYPFGAEIALTPHETPEEAMKFTGHERDIVAGDGHTLDYMHARFDNVSLGRFLSLDSHQGDPAHPQTWNRYTYSLNNPLSLVDPDGCEPIPANLLNFYRYLFGQDFSHVDVQKGMIAQVVTGLGHSDATTYNDTIYLNSDDFYAYRNESSEAIGTIAHELGHVIQQDSYKGFYAYDYFNEASKNGFGRNNRLETKQWQIADKVTTFLNNHLSLLVKIANGLPLTEAEKHQIMNILGNGDEQNPKPKPKLKPKQKPKPKPKPASDGLNDFED